MKLTNEDDQSSMEIDNLIHGQARLKIMARLYVVESADAVFLIQKTGLTWGNLSVQMRKLESAGYIEVMKQFVGKKPHTTLKLTEKGRAAFIKYRKIMKQVLE